MILDNYRIHDSQRTRSPWRRWEAKSSSTSCRLTAPTTTGSSACGKICTTTSPATTAARICRNSCKKSMLTFADEGKPYGTSTPRKRPRNYSQNHEILFSTDPYDALREDVAVIVLRGLGVADSMVPLNPRLGSNALGTRDLGGAWRGGAVAPAMFRTLAQMLMMALPAGQRSQLGRLLTESAEVPLPGFQSDDRVLLSRLDRLPEDVWNSYCYRPVEVQAIIERCRSRTDLHWLGDGIVAVSLHWACASTNS